MSPSQACRDVRSRPAVIAVRCAFFLAAMVIHPATASTLEWALWGAPANDASAATFSDGRSVTLTAFFAGFGEPAGLEYTSSPAIPGTTGGTNPSFIRVLTGSPHPTTVNANATIAEFTLNGWDADSSTIVGIADQLSGTQYRLELLDANGALLSTAGLTVTPYNLTYTGSGLVADYNSLLVGGVLFPDDVHDAGSFYQHTGLTTLSNLPAGTRKVRLASQIFQNSEGIQLYFATEVVPAPPALVLFLTGAGVVLARARRRREVPVGR